MSFLKGVIANLNDPLFYDEGKEVNYHSEKSLFSDYFLNALEFLPITYDHDKLEDKNNIIGYVLDGYRDGDNLVGKLWITHEDIANIIDKFKIKGLSLEYKINQREDLPSGLGIYKEIEPVALSLTPVPRGESNMVIDSLIEEIKKNNKKGGFYMFKKKRDAEENKKEEYNNILDRIPYDTIKDYCEAKDAGEEKEVEGSQEVDENQETESTNENKNYVEIFKDILEKMEARLSALEDMNKEEETVDKKDSAMEEMIAKKVNTAFERYKLNNGKKISAPRDLESIYYSLKK